MLRQVVPVSDMTIWRWERDGLFPRHVTVNSRNYWLFSEVNAWLAAQRRGNASSAEERHG
jgi:predicted DNA-binding transcriptional regulator AlpA